MKKNKLIILGGAGMIVVVVVVYLLLSTQGYLAWAAGLFNRQPVQSVAQLESAEEVVEEATLTMTVLPTATMTVEAVETIPEAATASPEAEIVPTEDLSIGPFGPNGDDFPLGINPLTGLLVTDPDTLDYLPALVSITNWPVNARPQAGLGSSAWVYELYIGQGMSRFLALFYGAFPGEEGSQEDDAGSSGMAIDNTDADSIGPIRSGRLPYEGLRRLNNGFLVMASAYAGVAKNLDAYTNVFGSDGEDINSAMIPADKLKEIAAQYEGQLVSGSLSGNVFDADIPTGGVPGETFWFVYNPLNQIAWQFDTQKGVYYRYQDLADGLTFARLTDRTDGESVDISNVILLFANHRYCTEKAFDIDFLNINKFPAVIFRDGQKFDVFWTTKSEDFEFETGKFRPIRFIDADGNPFPLKPGSSWVMLAPYNTPIWESPVVEPIPMDQLEWIPSEGTALLYQLLNTKESGTGQWVSRFYQSLMIYDNSVCTQIN